MILWYQKVTAQNSILRKENLERDFQLNITKHLIKWTLVSEQNSKGLSRVGKTLKGFRV